MIKYVVTYLVDGHLRVSIPMQRHEALARLARLAQDSIFGTIKEVTA